MSAVQNSKQRILHRKYPYFLLTLLLSLLVGWLLTRGVHARDVPLAAPTDEPAYVLGEPCGSGELLPEWTLCLHGSVALDDAGETSLLAGIPITVTYGSRTVTGTTFVHPGQTTPTYGIDISPLEPAFLKPITVTADVSGAHVTRQVVVYPDFRTQNQRFDLRVPTVGALDPAPIWGSVVEFSARGPVTGATVTATANGHAVSVTTALHAAYDYPIYTLSQTDLDLLEVAVGDPLTLTATYGNDSDRRVVSVGETPQQVNFVTGWKCDGFDPLPRTSGGEGMPRTSGGEGMPRTSGGEGMPNVACFWGYGVVDGEPRVGVDVYLEISGTVHTGATQAFAREARPRYGIGLWGGDAISGEMASFTGVYENHATNCQVTITLDADLSQQIDISISRAEALSGGPYGGRVKSIAFTSDFSRAQGQGSAWLIVSGAQDNVYRRQAGASAWELDNAGLEGYRFDSIAASPDCDELQETGSLWALVRNPDNDVLVARRSCAEETWQPVHALPVRGSGTDEIYISDNYVEESAQGSVWVALETGCLYSYSLSLDQWHVVPLPSLHNGLQAFARSSDYDPEQNSGSLWIATQSADLSLVAYQKHSYTSTWTLVAEGLPRSDQPQAHALAFSPDGALWMGTTQGVYKLMSGNTTWQKQGRLMDHGLEAVYDLMLSPDFDESEELGYVYVAALEGAFRLPAGTSNWEALGKINPWEYGNCLAVSPDFDPVDNQGTLLVGFGDFGVFTYQDGVWYDANTGLSPISIEDIFVNNRSENVWAASSSGIFVSKDGGVHWARVDEESYQRLGGAIFAVSPDYDDETETGSIWLFNGYDRILRWAAGETAWQIQSMVQSGVRGIIFTPDYDEDSGQGEAWSWRSDGLPYRISGPEGTWISVTQGLPDSAWISSLKVTPDYNVLEGHGSVWIGTDKGVYQLQVGDTSWVTVTTGTPLMNNFVFSTNYDEAANIGIVVGVSDSQVYQRFRNGDGMWHQVSNALPDTVSSVAISPDYNGIDEGIVWAGTLEGLFMLRPGRHDWLKVNGLMVHKIVLSPSYETDRALILATGAGVIRYVVPSTDLHVSFDSASLLTPSSVATYTVRYGNAGLATAWDTVLTLTHSDGIHSLTSTLPPSKTEPLQWHLGSVPSDTQHLITLTVQLSPTLEPGQSVTLAGEMQSDTPEDFLLNNRVTQVDPVVAPDHADARVSVVGPATLVPGAEAVYTLWADDVGALDAQTPTVTVDLPVSLTYHSAHPAPITVSPPTWQLETLASGAAPVQIVLTTTVVSALPAGTDLAVTAAITTTTPDANPLNNTASVTASTALTEALTLILVAPARLTDAYGASPLLSKLHQVAVHPRVQGVVVDVLGDPAVRTAYAAWDADPGSITRANAVAEAIKTLVDDYTLTYPNLQYIVLVGNDAMLPFYRVRDQNATHWRERGYCPHTPAGTVKSALCADYFLTDDFYAAPVPTYPSSPFWQDGHPFYLPELAIGRLVETPEEIIAAIDAFLETDGNLEMSPALIGTHHKLVDDLGDLQCTLFQEVGLSTSCITQPEMFRTQVLQALWGTLSAAFHSNHRNLGRLSASDLRDMAIVVGRTFAFAIGCHSGTSVDDGNNPYLSYDLPQAFQQHGWPFIAPTAYAYASPFGVEYSEALMVELTEQLLSEEEEIGQMLAQAKQAYYADRGWFDYTDEKVLLPVTLYGLPMFRITRPPQMQLRTTETIVPTNVREIDHLTVFTHTLDNLTYTLRTTPNGKYYMHQDQIIAQDGYPIQPHEKIPLPTRVGNRVLRGIRLQGANYSDETPFNPVVAQSWAISEPQPRDLLEPTFTSAEWDRPVPHRLGLFEGLDGRKATLNVALGAFNAETQTERRFTDLNIEVFYGTEADQTAPDIVTYSGFTTTSGNFFYATVEDDSEVWQVTALYDDGSGTWSQFPLGPDGKGRWMGQTELPIARYYLQVVDTNGNVTRTEWRTLIAGQSLYLPLVLR